MIKALENMPPNVIGLEAVGEVHSDDYKNVLVPAVEAAIDAGHKVRMVYVCGDQFDGFSAGAMWEDAKLGAEHLRAFERCALVTDKDWIRNLTGGFAWMMPAKVKLFHNDELDAAVAWIAADDE
jgi:hypothetical protein